MTLSLLLLRHGKSDWNADYDGDHERPLKSRGRKAAGRMGRLLTLSGQTPDLVLSSSAVRARSTAELAQDHGEWLCPLRVTPELYEASTTEVLGILRSIGHGPSRVMLVGHEPTCSETVALFTDGPPPEYPTATLARIDFDAESWEELEPGSGTLRCLIPPRLLEGVALECEEGGLR